MKRYFLQRLFLFIPTLIGAVTLVFLLIHFIPGDPIEVLLGETASAADKEELRHTLGLDRPVASQYRDFLGGLIAADLGKSLYEQARITDLIAARLPATLKLTFCAMTMAILISFPLALFAAVFKHSWIDRAALLFSLLGVSMPNFWIGPLFMMIFSIQLGWLPVSGQGGPAHLILPSLTLGLGMAAILTRTLRSSLLQVTTEQFIQAARARGLSEGKVWLKHTLRNALLSVITIVSLQFGSLLAGSIITETIFSWPGLGRLTVQAIQTRDYPLVQGCILVIAVSYLLVNFLTDIAYRFTDPRITYVK